ncbi:lipopolysaccharide biosynthesis protein WzxC [Vibrio astriarenae]|nr:lipopolysaccharide biosynthesis protein WzxC [Vibrio sp. C7]
MMAKIQNDDVELSQSYQNTLQLTALLTFPLMFGLCFLAHPFVYVVLGSKWVPSAELISILSLAFLLYPIHAINLNVLQVKGRSDLFLKLEIIKRRFYLSYLCLLFPLV